ncbi:hypothetical protein E2C01_057950 [Portunus trituberculatus]|uniref:Endonuclease/exonuclease/phosphatase domain-containing protein n=1 Tax=Portunus trituberculatus TaxID=210409 RepID=A0A5B7H4R0_PORTR|nr:hypothetical protein [Portunus trituberculatus]
MLCGDGVEVLALELHVGSLWLLVYNIYRSQRHQLEAGELLTLAAHTSLLVGGDFNAHHAVLHSLSRANEAGRHLAVLLEDVPYVRLLNTGEATHTWGGRLDLTLVLRDLAAGAAWRERDVTEALQRAADAAIPCARSRRHRPDWWFYNEEVREQNHRVNVHRKLYKRCPNPTNLRLLQDVVAGALEVSLKAKDAKWLEWCSNLSQHTSLGQLWRSIRTASGAAPPRPAAHPHPQQEAERLPRRDYAFRASVEEADDTDRAFTQQELDRAKRRGRGTAAGSDGVLYSMLAHVELDRDAALLALSSQEFENGTPQGSILSPCLFNLMGLLVALPFQDGTVLLSYADDLDLISEKCEG